MASIEPVRRNSTAWATVILSVLILTIYLCFLTKNYYWDGIAFAQAIEGAPQIHPSLVHPNHLIYNLVGYVFYRGLQSAGLSLRAVTALQILNAFLSALTCALLFYILKITLRSTYFSIALTLLFAFSATWWKYSTDAGAYIPSIFFLLLSFYFVLPAKKSRPVIVALLYALSLCLHQMAIVFFPVLLFALFVQDPELTRRGRFTNCLFLSVISGGLTLGAYVYSFFLLTGGFHLKNFLLWSLSYAPDDSFGFRPLINLGFTLRGHNRLLFGGRFNAITGLINPFIVFLMIAWVALFVTFAFKVIRYFKLPGWKWFRALKQDPLRGKVAKVCVVWISVYLVALYIFVAHHTYYRLFYLPALIILMGLIFDSYQRVTGSSRKYRLAIFVALVVITNFLMVTYPYTHVAKYPPLAFALEMNRVWPRHTVIYYGSANSDNNLVKYFNQGTNWKKLELENAKQLEKDLHDARSQGLDTWLDTSAIDQLASSPTGADWLKRHIKTDSRRALMTKAHNIRFVQVEPAH